MNAGLWFEISLLDLLFIAIFLMAYAAAITIALIGLGKVAQSERSAKN